MNLSLEQETRRFIDEKVRSGRYASHDDVIRAALAALQQQEAVGDFAPGELDALLAEGEESIRREGTIPAEQVFEELRRRSRERRAKSGGKRG